MINLKVVQAVFRFQNLGVAHTGSAKVNANHPRLWPAQGMFGRLRSAAARYQDSLVLTVTFCRPKQVIIGTTFLRICQSWRYFSRLLPAEDTDIARKSLGLRHLPRLSLQLVFFVDSSLIIGLAS